MLELLLKFWYFWLLVIIALLYKLFRPVIKGWFGEKTVSLYLKALPGDDYAVINDVILPTERGTTQIDHIVVSLYGIFVIETKNYTGWIYGSENSAQWTQNIYGKKNKFMNPLRQNFAHVEAIRAKLSKYPDLPIVPIAAFSPSCDLKVKTQSHVVYFHRITGVIRKYKDKVINNSDVLEIVRLLGASDISSAEVRKEHIESVKNKKATFDNAVAGMQCPKCGGLLVERKGKNGSFIGCSNFPKCRFTKTAG